MQKKQITLDLEKMTPGGDAFGHFHGKAVFVGLALPSEKVLVEVTENHKSYAKARLLSVLEESPHRTKPICPYFGKCGGCDWQQIAYSQQVEFKQEILRELLVKIGRLENPALLNPIAAPSSFHYRNRIRLQVGLEGEVGFFRAQSESIVSIESCAIANEQINAAIPAAKELAVRLAKKFPDHKKEIGIFWDGKKTHLQEDPKESLFSQINPEQNTVLVKRVLEALELSQNTSVLELYAGSGNFTLPLAKLARQVFAVEAYGPAARTLELAVAKKHVSNVEIFEATAERALLELSKKRQNFSHALLDPPRQGAKEVIATLLRLKIPRVVYVSCDPATLARDVHELITGGYRHVSSQLIDLFPQTHHAESITILERVI